MKIDFDKVKTVQSEKWNRLHMFISRVMLHRLGFWIPLDSLSWTGFDSLPDEGDGEPPVLNTWI